MWFAQLFIGFKQIVLFYVKNISQKFIETFFKKNYHLFFQLLKLTAKEDNFLWTAASWKMPEESVRLLKAWYTH